MSTDDLTVTMGKNDHNKRVDAILRRLYREVPLSALYRLIRRGAVRVNGARIALGARVRTGDRVAVARTRLTNATPHAAEEQAQRYRDSTARRNATRDSSSPESAATRAIAPQVGALCWENDHLLALNKRRGAPLFDERNADRALSCQEEVRRYLAADPRVDWGASFIPSALHRLDRGASGIVCFSKSIYGARAFSELLRRRLLRKRYLAIVCGELREAATWHERLAHEPRQHLTVVDEAGGQEAHTVARPLSHGKGRTLVEITILTGRRHQIRAHAAAHGYPLLGDRKYGGQPSREGYFLHACWIGNETHSPPAPSPQADSSAASLFDTIACPLSEAQRRETARLLRVSAR